MRKPRSAKIVAPYKSELRQAFKEKRAAIRSDLRVRYHERIAMHLGELVATCDKVENIAVYLAAPMEADLDPWIRLAWAHDLALFAPVVDTAKHAMSFHALKENTPLRTGRYALREPQARPDTRGIEPSALDIALVPLVAFDAHGTRLGMGGGYYDRYFAALANRPRLVGVAYEVQLAATPLPIEPWDIKLDEVITENGCYDVASGRS